MKFDQDLCLNLQYDFGKMNSTLGSVVPLAMFICEHEQCAIASPCCVSWCVGEAYRSVPRPQGVRDSVLPRLPTKPSVIHHRSLYLELQKNTQMKIHFLFH